MGYNSKDRLIYSVNDRCCVILLGLLELNEASSLWFEARISLQHSRSISRMSERWRCRHRQGVQKVFKEMVPLCFDPGWGSLALELFAWGDRRLRGRNESRISRLEEKVCGIEDKITDCAFRQSDAIREKKAIFDGVEEEISVRRQKDERGR